jgi:hypothetical protein
MVEIRQADERPALSREKAEGKRENLTEAGPSSACQGFIVDRFADTVKAAV